MSIKGRNIVVVGAGEVGCNVAQRLSAEGANVYVVEKEIDKVNRIKSEIDAEVICGNGARPHVLAEAGVIRGGDTDILIACTNRDEVNMLSCWIAHSAGVPRVISRTRSLEFTDTPDWGRKLGIDIMISPERSIAREIMGLLQVSSATRAAELLGGKAALYTMKIADGSPLDGIALKDIRAKFPALKALFVYLESPHGSGVPGGNDVLHSGDVCYVVTFRESANLLEKLLCPNESGKSSGKIFIVGGGKLGTQIALMIKREFGNISLRIIDADLARCKKLSEDFGEDLVLNIDGSDSRALHDEGIDGADAYICATSSDELNMIYCAMAKTMGARRTIAVVRRKDYRDVAPEMGISAAVDAYGSLSDVILQYAKYQSNTFAYSMIDSINAEMLEVSLRKDLPVTGKTLAELNLGKGAVIALIRRGEEILLPDGATRLQEDDRVILFAVDEMMDETAELFGAEKS